MEVIETIWKSFFPGQPMRGYRKLSGGLINRTYIVEGSSEKIILQTVNSEVFKDPGELNANLKRVSEHLERSDFPYEFPRLLTTPEGRDLVVLDNGSWRMVRYISDAYQLTSITSEAQPKRMGKAFGAFVKHTADFDPSVLFEPIPGFLDFSWRMDKLRMAMRSSEDEHRLKEASFLAGQLAAMGGYVDDVVDKLQECPMRVIHGDPKPANLLWHAGGQAVKALIDFDTVRSGPLFYDISDMARSVAATRAEDFSGDLKSLFSPHFLTALLEGYLSEVGSLLTSEEKRVMDEGLPLVTLIQSVRFLTDYLEGDVYYQVDKDHHNLIRAKNQWELFRQMREYLSGEELF